MSHSCRSVGEDCLAFIGARGGRIIKVRRRCIVIAHLGVENTATQWSDTDERDTYRANLLQKCVVAQALSVASEATQQGVAT